MDTGIAQALRTLPPAPLPVSWLGRPDMTVSCPDWAVIAQLSGVQQQNLLAQIAYVSSDWSYTKIGANNELGRYQFDTNLLETYQLLTAGSNNSYGTDCVNYQHCWRAPSSTYANYLSEVINIGDFLIDTSAQELLAYQRLVDLYSECVKIAAIKINDTADVVAGMLYVAWALGTGTAATLNNTSGTGAYAWSYFGIGAGASYYTAGRYAITILSK